MKATKLFLKLKARSRLPMASALRQFSTGGMMSMKDDEFLPDFEEKEIKHMQQLESQIIVTKKPDSMLKHNEEVGGLLYKYDLPVENIPVVFRSQMLTVVETPNTALENMFEVLACDKETAYESFVIKMN